MEKAKMILVGGFLGAGKTTLLAQAAKLLVEQGKRVGLVTNDQADDLVDTGLLRHAGMNVREVTGGCFCCRFPDLVDAAQRLMGEFRPGVLIGEPVGSCTDLSATVLQPLKQHHSEQFDLAPFSVLVDPDRLRDALDSNSDSLLHPSARYILTKQLEEADVIVINKIDLLAHEDLAALITRTKEAFNDARILAVSALTGNGVGEWLEDVLQGGSAGRRIVDVDYDTYAEGEAVLGWLNATVGLSSDRDVDWRDFADALMPALRKSIVEASGHIAHVKFLLSSAGGQCAANLTSTHGSHFIRGRIDGNPREAALILNARVEMPPEVLRTITENCLQSVAVKYGVAARIVGLRCLKPGRPEPTYRYGTVI